MTAKEFKMCLNVHKSCLHIRKPGSLACAIPDLRLQFCS